MEILCLTIVIKQKCLTSILPSVGVVDNGTSPLCSDILDNNFKFDNVLFTEENVMRAMGKLKSNLSCGPDDLPPLLFTRLKHCLALPLALVFSQLL